MLINPTLTSGVKSYYIDFKNEKIVIYKSGNAWTYHRIETMMRRIQSYK